MGKVVKKIKHAAGSIAHATRNIPGVNALTSPLALIDHPSDFADIWTKNILPQYAAGAVGGLGALGAGALGLTGTGALGAAGAGAGLDAAGEAAAAGLGNYSLAGGLGGSSGLLGGLGGLLGGVGGGSLTNYLPLLAQIGGGIYSANASKDASQAQVAAANRAMDLQNQQFLFQQAQQEPFRQAGLTGQNRLLDLMGLSNNTTAAGYGKYAKDFSAQDFQEDPGYQFRLSEGLKALDQQAAARGGLISGAALKASQRYGQNAASDEYQNAFNRYQVNRSNQLNPLQALAGQAQSATNTLGQASQNYANQGANALQNAGNARASGYVGQANALTDALGGALNYYQGQQAINRLPRY